MYEGARCDFDFLPPVILSCTRCTKELQLASLVPRPLIAQSGGWLSELRLSKQNQIERIVMYTCAVVIGTAPGWSTKNCLSSLRSAKFDEHRSISRR